MTKLITCILQRVGSDIDKNHLPQILYEDQDKDNVVLASDSDFVAAVEHARFVGCAKRTTVSNVAKHFPTAIISRRSHDKIYYDGSHEMDIMGPVQRCGSSSDHLNSIRTSDKQGME